MIIFDLDGTLADCEHRRHFVDVHKAVEKGIAYEHCEADFGGVQFKGYFLNSDPDRKWKPHWKAFYEACDKDRPIGSTICMFRNQMMFTKTLDEKMGWEIWSGRCESVREKTIQWLVQHISVSFNNSKFQNQLKMRPIGDSTPDDVLKEKWLDEAIAEGKTIDFVFDYRPKVIRMWRRRGMFVFNCAQHDEEF